MRVSWEYKAIELWDDSLKPLGVAGREGWELAAMMPGTRSPAVAILKRSRVEHDRPPKTEVAKLIEEVRRQAAFLAKRNLCGEGEAFILKEAQSLGKLVLELLGERDL